MSLGEEHKLKALENKVHRKVFGPERDEVILSGEFKYTRIYSVIELHDQYVSTGRSFEGMPQIRRSSSGKDTGY
jgi:hypothetical protein